MSDVTLPCPASGGCQYTTPALPFSEAMQLLALHKDMEHAVRSSGTETNIVKAEKVPRPVVKLDMGEDEFLYFTDRWESYKRATGLVDVQHVRDQLLAACGDQLSRDLFRLVGSSIQQLEETQLLRRIKQLAVRPQNNLINVVKLLSLEQERDEAVRNFLARLKGAANVCKLTVPCTADGCNEEVSYADQVVIHALVRGLVDEEIREEILAVGEDKSLDDTVKIIEAKEAGRRSAKHLGSSDLASSQLNRLTTYRKDKNHRSRSDADGPQRCEFCNRKGHGSRPGENDRKNLCPAWNQTCFDCQGKGHYKGAKTCKGKPAQSNQVTVKTDMCSLPGVMLKSVTSDIHSVKLSVSNPVPHMVQVGARLVPAAPQGSPEVEISLSVDAQSYQELGLQQILVTRRTKKRNKTWPTVDMKSTADTGAQIDCISVAQMGDLGLKRHNLFKPGLQVDCANKTDAGLVGVFFGRISAVGNRKAELSLLVYVLEKGSNLLSRTSCERLGIIQKNFPQVVVTNQELTGGDPCVPYGTVQEVAHSLQYPNEDGDGLQPIGECDPDSSLPCRCPRRDAVEPPEKIPFPPTADNRQKLEDWIKEYYASSAFNVCKRQLMPCTEGSPMKIHTKEGAIPKVVHKPVPVALHWREQVKADLDADVKRGVLERVPMGVPDTWCTKMVITPKKDGRPRRTVDLAALSRAGIRETHHTRSPFKVVCTVPSNMLKSTLDCVDGYHGVSIAEEDKHKTTFITEWGRYRYTRVPQGYGSSNDGYTLRTDEILASVPNRPDTQDFEKIVDDVIQWSQDLESSFFRVCRILSHGSKAGMLFCPKKFQFASEEVEYAGFMVGKDTIRPTDQYIETIRNFPSPQNISDVRSWFGIINQVAYAFSKSEVMAPFRPLLQKSHQFCWTPELETAFIESKKKIVDLVINGVKMFDPNLVTCLSTDYSDDGVGWILQQKTCTCELINPRCCQSGWRLVLASGKFNNDAERRYSPTEGEALAVVRALEGTKYYTLGCPKLYVATDHKPLLSILNDRALDTIDNPRLVKLKQRTLWWRFQLIYVPGSQQEAADSFSRRRISAMLCRLSVVKGQVPEIDDKLCTQLTVQLDTLHVSPKVVIGSVDIQPRVVTLDQVRLETSKDKQLLMLKEQIERGFPDSQHEVEKEIREFHKFRHGLLVVDGVICYKLRIVIPQQLQQSVLNTLHSSHQGVTGMINRAEQSVFWPSISLDIQKMRNTCLTCTRNAPSQPMTEPVDPPSPEYPFQMISGDYFSLYGMNYLVLADRYSGWFSVYQCGKGNYDADKLIDLMKDHFGTFGVSMEFASDNGAQFAATKFSKFLTQYGVVHRLSSSYNPHSNSRAELAVKSAKRLMRDSVNADGSFGEKFYQGVLQYRNTPLQDVRLSPAQIVFGRNIKDFIPIVGSKYQPRQEWCLVRQEREKALAKRYELDGRRLSEHTKTYQDIPVGTDVAVQNQTGRDARKWDKTGKVVDTAPHNKVVVKIDGSNRLTTRNRRYVKPILPVITPRVHLPTSPSSISPQSSVRTRVVSPESPYEDTQLSPASDLEVDETLSDDCAGQQGHTSPAQNLECEQNQTVTETESDISPRPVCDEYNLRPKRAKKANVKYSEDIYDLSSISVVDLLY